MITDWRYIDPPSGIDLDAPLMPLRDDSDNLLYGVDPAWIGEVLSVWLYKGDEAEKVVMPREPSAEYTNHLRRLADAVKPVNETSNHYFKTIPTGMFWTLEDIASHKVSFGDVPADVSVGDPVRRSDVMGMYDWMADVRYCQFEADLAPHTIQYATPSQGFTGAYWADPAYRTILDPMTNEIYEYYWTYIHFQPGDTYEYMEGGYWFRRYAESFTITVNLPGLDARYFKSAAAFVRVSANTSISLYRYIPLSNVSMSSSSDGITIAARCTPTVLVSTMNVTEKAYTTGKTDGYHLRLTVGSLCVFLEFADDYRHP